MPELLAPALCVECHTELAPGLLSCPGCHRLVHAETLKRLAEEAERAQASGDPAAARDAWRQALDLLPAGARQREPISARVAALSREVDARASSRRTAAHAPSWVRRAGPLGAVALLLWKLKFVVAFVLTKGKLLLLGLTKSSTLFSMLLSLGVYWTAWGWRFALGLVVSMYIHEMGHVAALARYGIRATPPMFVPGLGAFVRLKQYPADPREDASVGLAGPLWGLGAALAAWGVSLATGSGAWAAIARVGAWLNLFNLVPIWQLDGGRGFRALSRGQRFVVALVCAAMWAWTSEGLLGLLLIVAAVRTLGGAPPQASDRTAFAQYVFLVVALSALSAIPLAVPEAAATP